MQKKRRRPTKAIRLHSPNSNVTHVFPGNVDATARITTGRKRRGLWLEIEADEAEFIASEPEQEPDKPS